MTLTQALCVLGDATAGRVEMGLASAVLIEAVESAAARSRVRLPVGDQEDVVMAVVERVYVKARTGAWQADNDTALLATITKRALLDRARANERQDRMLARAADEPVELPEDEPEGTDWATLAHQLRRTVDDAIAKARAARTRDLASFEHSVQRLLALLEDRSLTFAALAHADAPGDGRLAVAYQKANSRLRLALLEHVETTERPLIAAFLDGRK